MLWSPLLTVVDGNDHGVINKNATVRAVSMQL